MNSAIRAASRPHGLTEVTFVDLWPLLLENSGPTAHYFQRNSYLKLFWFFSSQWRKYFLHCEENIFFTVKKNIIFEFFWVFILLFTRKNPENLKKQSVSIIVSIFVKKNSPTNVRNCFFLLFTCEKKICLWTFCNFSRPLASKNFKIGFTRKCSSHSWTGEKRSLTVGKIFFTQKRDNYTNKVLLFDKKDLKTVQYYFCSYRTRVGN